MATIYLGRMEGAVGFRRVVAIKRLHANYATDPEFAAMFLDEARLTGRVRHPNVVATLDAVAHEAELFLVMELVLGSSLAELAKQMAKVGDKPPPELWSSVISGALQGLHAAHSARDELGHALDIVHRDVSPQNILVGADGVARMIDFGVAKAVGQTHHTREGHIKGKLGYLAPEQILGQAGDARVDVFAAGVVLWELLTEHRLFFGPNEGAILRQVLESVVPPPSSINPAVPAALDDVVLRALERDPTRRFSSAAEMAAALEAAVLPLTSMHVAEWVRKLDGPRLDRLAEDVVAVESLALSGMQIAALPSSPRVEPEEEEPDAPTVVVPYEAPARWPWRGALLVGALLAVAILGALGARHWHSSASSSPPAVQDTVAAAPPPASAPPSPSSLSAPASAAPSAPPVREDETSRGSPENEKGVPYAPGSADVRPTESNHVTRRRPPAGGVAHPPRTAASAAPLYSRD